MGVKQDILLSDGKELTVDVSDLKVKEWRGLFDANQSDEDGDKVLARLTGLDPEEILEMLRNDLKLIVKTVIELSNSPLDDPNSASESIKE